MSATRRRLLLFVPMAAGMVVVTFSLLLLIPGDPAAVLLGQEASAGADRAAARAASASTSRGISGSGAISSALAHGDLGRSIFQNQPVAEIIAGRLGATLELAVAALVDRHRSSASRSASLAAISAGAVVDTGTCCLRSSAFRCRSTGSASC